MKGYFEQAVQTKQLIKRIGTPSEVRDSLGTVNSIFHYSALYQIAEAYMFLMKYVSSILFTVSLLNPFKNRCQYITGERIDVNGGVSLA